MNKFYKTITVAMMAAGLLYTAPAAQATISERVAVFGGGNANEPNEYRIPALGNDGKGTLIAFCDDRGDNGSDIGVNGGTAHVLYKISKDNGATWSEARRLAPESFNHQHGDVAVAYDAQHNRFVVLFVGDESWSTGNRGTIWATYSTNTDYTEWSTPKDVTNQFVPESNKRGFCSSGTMMYKDGAVYVVLCKSTNAMSAWIGKNYISNVLFKSEDGGENWTKVSGEYNGGDESHVVALDNGDLIMSRRKNGNGTGYKNRNFKRSTDGGQTFSNLSATIDESGCNGDLFVYNDGTTEWLLQSLNLNRSGSDYNNRPLVIYASANGGQSWVQGNTIDNGEYSCLTRLTDNKIGIYYEQNSGEQFCTYFKTVDLADVTPKTNVVFEGYLNTNEKNYLNIGNEDAKKLAEVADGGVMTVTARVLCSKFESGSAAKDRGIMSTRADGEYTVNEKLGLITVPVTYYTTRGFDMYGGNATNPFGINMCVNQNGKTWGLAHNFVLANHSYPNFYEKDKDKWTHVTVVFDPSKNKCWSYINGQKYEEQGFPGKDGNSQGVGDQYDNGKATGKGLTVYDILTIGTRYKDNSLIWQGGIDDVRFYNKALSQEEIEADIKSGFPIFTGEQMRGAFDFAAKNGDVMTDITGKGINATAANPYEDYRFPETDQNATQVNVTVVDREGNVINNATDAYQLYRYIDGALATKSSGAMASVNTDFMITAKQLLEVNSDTYNLYAIFVNDKEVDPFDFNLTNFGIGNDVTGGYFKSANAVNDVKVVYSNKEETPAFKLVGENYYYKGKNKIISPYEAEFEYNGDGNYTLLLDTEKPEFEIEAYEGENIVKKQTMTGLFHVEEFFPDEVQAVAAEDGNNARQATAARSFYAHEVHRAQPGHEAVQLTHEAVRSLQNVDNQATPIHFTTNDPANPTEPNIGFNKPLFTLTYTPTARTLKVTLDQNGGTTGVEEVAVDSEDAPVEIYTLSGIRVPMENLTPGFYIRRQGRKATKILVR